MLVPINSGELIVVEFDGIKANGNTVTQTISHADFLNLTTYHFQGFSNLTSVFLGGTRVRPALPDDFSVFVAELEKRLDHKHHKDSPEGRALRQLREIRIQAAPSWRPPKSN